MGFCKAHDLMLRSSVWDLSSDTRCVWMTMLMLTDLDGVVEASVPGLARLARVSLEACEEALAVLSAPDRYSQTKDHEGRRISEVEGGWVVLNYDKYRKRGSEEEKAEKAAARQRRKRARDAETERRQIGDVDQIRHAPSRPVTPCHAPLRLSRQAEAEAEAEAEAVAPAPPKRAREVPDPESPRVASPAEPSANTPPTTERAHPPRVASSPPAVGGAERRGPLSVSGWIADFRYTLDATPAAKLVGQSPLASWQAAEGIARALEAYGRETVERVVLWTQEQAAEHRTTNGRRGVDPKFYGRMFAGDGFGARLEAYEQHLELERRRAVDARQCTRAEPQRAPMTPEEKAEIEALARLCAGGARHAN